MINKYNIDIIVEKNRKFCYPPILLSTHLYYTTQFPSCQSLPSIINKTFTNTFSSWLPFSTHPFLPIPSSVFQFLNISPFLNTLPFPFPLKTNYPHVYGFFIWEPQGSINEKRFDGDPNEVRGRGEKTESFRAKEGVWGNLVPQIYMILESNLSNGLLTINYNKTYNKITQSYDDLCTKDV